MEFAHVVSNPSMPGKTEQEEEQEEEEEDEENNVQQECRTFGQEDTKASELSKQTQEPNETEHKGIKSVLYYCPVVCYVCKAQEVLDVTVLLSADTSVSF
jgi:hypothetical protein